MAAGGRSWSQKYATYAKLPEEEARIKRQAWESHVTTHTPATQSGEQRRDASNGLQVLVSHGAVQVAVVCTLLTRNKGVGPDYRF